MMRLAVNTCYIGLYRLSSNRLWAQSDIYAYPANYSLMKRTKSQLNNILSILHMSLYANSSNSLSMAVVSQLYTVNIYSPKQVPMPGNQL